MYFHFNMPMAFAKATILSKSRQFDAKDVWEYFGGRFVLKFEF